MKKFLYLGILIVILTLVYLYSKEKSFSPLKETEFRTLFSNYKGEIKKRCSIDFIGLSSHGELFELYRYTTRNISIDTTYPKFLGNWEQKELGHDVYISKWKNCPVDTGTLKLYEFSFTTNEFKENKCSVSFKEEMLNPKNYYSFIYFNELEYYFLLLSPKKEELYYIRKKGL